MTVTEIDNIISALKSDTTLISMVSASNIRIGWVSTIQSFPSVVLTLIGGSATGRLGYQSSSTGSKLRTNTGTMQIDVYIDNESGGARKAGEICDRIDKIFLSGISGILEFHKDSDVMMYDDSINVWRRTMRWSYTSIVSD